MKTLVGVDASGTYRPALDLLGRLAFAENHTVLAHVEAPVLGMVTGSPIMVDTSIADVERAVERAGRALLTEAEQQARKANLTLNTSAFALGPASATLLDLANDHRSDLIAIGSKERGAVGSFFFGSVGRSLVINAPQSFLVARGKCGAGPVKAVFATDHSDYADRCFARLLDMNPTGLGEVTIVTATESRIEEEFQAEVGYCEDTPNSLTEREERFKAHGGAMLDRLTQTGRTGDFRLIEGHPADVLRRAMEETNADLLILGARGHGLIERVLIGSLALHEVVSEPCSVLVLRLPE